MIPQEINNTYEPLVDISEEMMLGIGDKKIGQKLQAIIDFDVIEKTKTFTILRIKSVYLLPVRRRF